MISPELQSKIASWRQRAVTGDLSEAECKEAVRLLREDRLSAAEASASSKRKRAAVEIPDASDLLADMMKDA